MSCRYYVIFRKLFLSPFFNRCTDIFEILHGDRKSKKEFKIMFCTKEFIIFFLFFPLNFIIFSLFSDIM